MKVKIPKATDFTLLRAVEISGYSTECPQCGFPNGIYNLHHYCPICKISLKEFEITGIE